jgi:oligoendopeptidase F
MPEGTVALDVALSRCRAPTASAPGDAGAVTVACGPACARGATSSTRCCSTRSVDDRLRDYPSWLSSRNLSNEASDESVQALVEAVKGTYELPQRWYTAQGAALRPGPPGRLRPAASVAEVDEEIGWDDARDIVLGSFDAFSPVLGNTARRFFDENWIDAPVRPSKRGGAFCAYTVPSVHPYVLLNYTSKRRDVLTLAHELGHGLHAALAQGRGPFEQHTPLTLAETASVFGETLVFKQLLDAATDPASRLSLLAENIEGSIATVFRQTAMNQFEDRTHTARRAEGELSVERIGECGPAQRELLGDAVEVTENYKTWWSYVPHFIGTPGLRLRLRLRSAPGPERLRPVPRARRGVRRLRRAAAARAARSRPRSSPRSPARPRRSRASGARASSWSAGSSRRPRRSRRRSCRSGDAATMTAWRTTRA